MTVKRFLESLCILFGSIGFFSVITLSALSASPKDSLVMAWNIDAIMTFDPAQTYEIVTSELLTNMCSTLVDYDQKDPSKIRPAMAKSWDVSDDGKTIIFHLRDDLKFDNGRKATAEDLAWSIRRLVKLKLSYSQFLGHYGFTEDNIDDSVQALDDTTLQVKFDKPYPIQLVLVIIGQTYGSVLLDRQTLEENAVNGDMGNKYLANHSACVGPYKLVRWHPSDLVELHATQHYWGEAPKIQKIVVRHVAESMSQRLLLEKGDVDIARDLSSEDVLAIEKQGGAVKINRILRPQSVYLALNSKNSILAHEKVRLAFRYLVDYDTLGKTVLKGIGIPRASYMPLGIPGALDEKEGSTFEFNIEKAKQLITEAGYPDGFKVNLVIGSLPYMSPVAQILKENVRKVGIDLTIERMSQFQLLHRFRGGNYDMVLTARSTVHSDGHVASLYHVYDSEPTFAEDDKGNLAWQLGYYSVKANEMVIEALFEREPDKRCELYRDLQRYMINYGPTIHLFQTYHVIGVSPSVKRWVWNSFQFYYDKAEKYKQ